MRLLLEWIVSKQIQKSDHEKKLKCCTDVLWASHLSITNITSDDSIIEQESKLRVYFIVQINFKTAPEYTIQIIFLQNQAFLKQCSSREGMINFISVQKCESYE